MAKKNQQLSAADIAAQSQLQEEVEIQKAFETGITTLRDLISPSSIEINSDYFRLGTKYGRTIYVYGYPRMLYTGWLSSIINIDEVLDISMYIYPVDTGIIMKNLTKKVTQLEASMSVNSEKGKVRDPELEAAISDAEDLRDQLQVGAENRKYLRSANGLLESRYFATRAGHEFYYASVYRPTPNPPQYEYWRYLYQFSIHLRRPHAGKRYSLRH